MSYRMARIAIAAAAICATASFAYADVVDGDFNDDTNFGTNWNPSTPDNGLVQDLKESAYNVINAQNSNPSVFWAFFGGGQQDGGSIFQNLATIVGQKYKLSFTYGGWGDTSEQRLEYSIAGITNVAIASVGSLTKDWNVLRSLPVYTLEFVASSTSTMLKFKDVSASSINADGVLTNVSVSAVPGPEAGAGLAGLVLAGMGAYVIRRRKASAA